MNGLSFSFNHFCRSPWYGVEPDLPTAIEACASAGFDLFAPDCRSLAAWQARGRALEELAQHLRDARIAAGPLAACAMIDGSEEALDQLVHAARMAQVLGSQLLQVNVTGGDRTTRATAVEAARDRISSFAPVRLALEFMPISGLATLEETVEIVSSVGQERAGALVDIWHLSHDPNGWATLADAPLSAIAYVEIDGALPPHSPDLLVEMMDRRTFPGDGVLETRRFADLLIKRGYAGPVSVEILSRDLLQVPIKDFAKKALVTSRALFIRA